MTRYSTQAEVDLLIKYAKQAKYGVVEIGVFDGETTKEYSKYSKVHIYGIDPMVEDSMPPHVIGNEASIKNNMAFHTFTFYKDFSYNVVKDFNHKFDMIWIDGSHIYSDVKRDFEQWFEKIERGGYILFHDTAPVTSIQPSPFGGWPGPTLLANELKNDPRVEFIEIVSTISVFRKV